MNEPYQLQILQNKECVSELEATIEALFKNYYDCKIYGNQYASFPKLNFYFQKEINIKTNV